MRKRNAKHAIFIKLQALIHSNEDLWLESKKLALANESTYKDGFYAKALMELELAEKHLGPTPGVLELKALIEAQS